MRRVVTAFLVLACPAGVWAADTADYSRDVKTTLARRCYSCHGALKQNSGLRLDTGQLARQGGDSGPAVVPGKPDESLLVQRITEPDAELRMPPDGEPLSADEIRRIETWIRQGAHSPDGEQPEPDPRDHWAFRPPVRPKLPPVKDADWGRNPVDRFILARMERRGLTPARPAARHVLLRRVSLDLTGLPPTREQLRQFLDDRSATAYQDVVDRLLESPQYGERWGRHWMDVWRYSDWYGRRQVNDVRNSYPHIWRWRDWIVDSLNDDHGYDRMVREMLAADEIAPQDDRAIAATGFIVRNWFSLNYDEWMKDLVEHTGKAFLGLRLNCAHCHDHKYDPISQEEYFRFRAFFEPLEFRHDRVPGGPVLTKYKRYVPGSGSSLKPIKAGLARIYDIQLDAKTFMYRLGDARDRFDRPPVEPGVPAVLGGSLEIAPVALPAQAWYPGLKNWALDAQVAQRRTSVANAQKELDEARQKMAAAGAEQPPEELGLQLSEARLENARTQLTAVQARIAAERARYLNVPGEADQLAKLAVQAERKAAVAAATVNLKAAEKTLADATGQQADATDQDEESAKKKQAAVAKAKKQVASAKSALTAAQKKLNETGGAPTSFGPQYPQQSTGRRRALVQWITSPQNPLTARVAVNHIWMRHFGRPLVESVFDFGRAGKKPTHPGLLDWLAIELMETGWSMKHLHRLIVTSRTYGLASVVDAGHPNLAIDGDNRFWWRREPRRMEAEVVRDSMLHCAGQLDLTLGGQDIDPKKAATSRRRSLYFSVYPEAGGVMPFMKLFDPPDPCDCYRRTESIVPQQALVMTNGPVALRSGRLLARKLWEDVFQQDEPTEEAEFVRAAFEQVLCRTPTDDDLQVCLEFLEKQAALFQGVQPGALEGKTANGVVAPSTDPAMRARESLVRALFSHHEFVTVR